MNPSYDQASPESIEAYGKRLVGKTLRTQVGMEEIPSEYLSARMGSKTRGSFGKMLERYYYGIRPGNDSMPDFPAAKVELKSTPLKKLSKGAWAAKERLVLNIINYRKEVENPDFDSSSVLHKSAQIMLVSYESDGQKAAVDNTVRIAKMMRFSGLPKEDQAIIRADWERIVAKIRAGKAHEISEGDTDYLAACTKGANKLSITTQPFNSTPAKTRAFSLKAGYMTVLLRQMLDSEAAKEEYEPAIKDPSVLKKKTFEQEIIGRFEPYIGKTEEEIREVVAKDLSHIAKDKYALLARRIMGVKGRKIEEFEKGEIMMKSIQLRYDGTPKEGMSFPAFKFKEVASQHWDPMEDEAPSEFQENLQRRFFFVIWRCESVGRKDESRTLERVFFWSMPVADLEIAKKSWEKAKRAISKNEPSSFPKTSDHKVIHVRPHGRNAADTDTLPNGKKFPKQSFWLNIDYLKSQVSK